MVAANLEIFLRLHREKVPLDRDVIFLAEAGEEGTPRFGIEYMIAEHWDQIDSEFALNEGGTALMENGKLKYMGVATTEKVPRGMTLMAHGASGHGSIPRLDNPIVHLSAAVAKLGSWQTPMRLNETTKLLFERLANLSEPKLANALRNLHDESSQKLLASEHPELYSKLRTSIVPTIIKGGFRSNVIPAEAEATLDVRALPDEDIDRLVAQMKELVNDPAKIGYASAREAGDMRGLTGLINAQGLAVAPGFINMLSQADESLIQDAAVRATSGRASRSR